MLGNMWPWSGGFAQYVSWATGTEIPYMPPAEGGDWDRFQRYSAAFFENGGALEAFAAHVRFVVSRRNAINGILYRCAGRRPDRLAAGASRPFQPSTP